MYFRKRFKEKFLFAVIGLGNPGEHYRETRHNSGYQVVEAFSRKVNAGKPYHLRYSLCASALYRSQRIILVQPLTYMNLSGRAVVELRQRYGLTPPQMVLVYDDLDLPVGAIRLRPGGSSAGHRGVQSVIEALGTEEVVRLRLGIGKPLRGGREDYVLEVPPPAEQKLLDGAVERAGEALTVLIDAGLEKAMSRFNRVL